MTGTAQAFMDINIGNMKLPKEGPRCIPVQCDFTVQTAVEIDGTQLISSGRMTVIQGVYVDNSTGAAPVIMTVGVTNQVITCPPYSQGYFSVLAISQFKMVVTSANANLQTVYLFNIPIQTEVWDIEGQFTFDSNGAVLVSDTALEALINAARLRTQIVTDIADVDANRFTTTAATQVVLEAANPGFFLDFITVTLSPDAAVAVAGVVTWSIRAGTTVLWDGKIYVPAASGAAGAAILAPVILLSLSDLGLKNLSGNDLNFIAGTALTSGAWYITAGSCPYTLNQ